METVTGCEFQKFPKMARLAREVIITEKIDGTNAQLSIVPQWEAGTVYAPEPLAVVGDKALYAGSRTRWLTVKQDNFGFAAWACTHADELVEGLGDGRHYGEWWGSGIQRNYGLKEKRFSLFNVQRWCAHDEVPQRIETADPRIEKWQERAPECVYLVPWLYRGPFDTLEVDRCIELLRWQGSYAAPGFMNPEGVVVFHTAANVGFKKTLKNDELPKSLVTNA